MTQYKFYAKEHNILIPDGFLFDSMAMPAWPEFNMDPTRPGFVGSPEYNGLQTVHNVIDYANIGMNSATDAT